VLEGTAYLLNLNDGGEYRLAFDTASLVLLTRRISWQAILSKR
jgi:hypothetical protein